MRLELHWFDREATATERVLFVTDLLMLFLILINLGFFVFDWAFGHALYRNFVYSLSPSFYDYYAREIHPNFILYDATFVAIYISEIILRWILALVRQTYVRWYFYPLVHWYDVLGCIPSGSFRWLRLLRVFAIVTRMHKLGVIDLRKTLFFEQALHLWDIFLEEITARLFLPKIYPTGAGLARRTGFCADRSRLICAYALQWQTRAVSATSGSCRWVCNPAHHTNAPTDKNTSAHTFGVPRPKSI